MQKNNTMEITIDEVRAFLNEFKIKAKAFGIIYRDDRDKNDINSLLKLGINNVIREEIIFSLEEIDYSEGPIIDTLNKGADMWVFGKDYNDTDIYIKISVSNRALCISFHEAEYPLKFPFKTQTL